MALRAKLAYLLVLIRLFRQRPRSSSFRFTQISPPLKAVSGKHVFLSVLHSSAYSDRVQRAHNRLPFVLVRQVAVAIEQPFIRTGPFHHGPFQVGTRRRRPKRENSLVESYENSSALLEIPFVKPAIIWVLTLVEKLTFFICL